MADDLSGIGAAALQACTICGRECTGRIRINDGFVAHVCTHCDFAMTDTRNVESSVAEINEQFYQLNDRVQTYYARSKEFEKKYGQLLSHLKACRRGNRIGSLLEVGSNIGYFAHYAQTHGIQVTSIEINDKMREFQQLVYGLAPLGDVEDLDEHATFDAIVMMDVLEHIPAPIDFLQLMAAHLEPDGIIFLQFPNKNSLAARLSGERWGWWQAPDHLFHFSQQAVHAAAARAGLTVSHCRAVSPVMDELTGLPRVGGVWIGRAHV